MQNPLNNGQVIEDKKDLRFFSQLLFILFCLGITVLSSGGDNKTGDGSLFDKSRRI
jgi:hypothetical protein